MLPVAGHVTDPEVTRRTLLQQMLACMCLPAVAVAQAQPAGRKIVFQQDLPNLALTNWSVTAVEVSYAPGESSAAHRHPGLTMAYVLEGEIRSKVGDGPEQSYTAGQMFLETPGQLHAVSRNASSTQPARLLALLLAEKGAQLSTPAKWSARQLGPDGAPVGWNIKYYKRPPLSARAADRRVHAPTNGAIASLPGRR